MTSFTVKHGTLSKKKIKRTKHLKSSVTLKSETQMSSLLLKLFALGTSWPGREAESRGCSAGMSLNIWWLERRRAQRGWGDQRSVAARAAAFPQFVWLAAGTHTSSGLASISPRDAVRALMYSLDWVVPWQPLPRRHLRIAKKVFTPYTHVTRKPKTCEWVGTGSRTV